MVEGAAWTCLPSGIILLPPNKWGCKTSGLLEQPGRRTGWSVRQKNEMFPVSMFPSNLVEMPLSQSLAGRVRSQVSIG